jgi:hypothetical protein
MRETVTREKMKDGSVLLRAGNSMCQMIDLGKGVSLHTCRGIVLAAFASHVVADGTRQLEAHERWVVMVDMLDSKSFETGFRETLNNWLKEHPGATAHLLIKSKLLEMAVSLANFFTGRGAAKAYTRVEEWIGAGKREVINFRRRPISDALSGPPV